MNMENEKDSNAKQKDPVEMILDLVIVIAYLALGCIFHLWHPGWLIFLFVPIIGSAIKAIRTKNAECFSYSALVLFVFLLVGFVKSIWHPTWLLFLTIPVYNQIIELFKRSKN